MKCILDMVDWNVHVHVHVCLSDPCHDYFQFNVEVPFLSVLKLNLISDLRYLTVALLS